jgi:hypothetical protein
LNELRNINQINCYEALTKATVVMYQYTWYCHLMYNWTGTSGTDYEI